MSNWLSYMHSRNALERQTDQAAIKQVAAAARQMDDYVVQVSMLERAIAARRHQTGQAPDLGMNLFLSQLLQDTPPDQGYGI